MADVTTVGRTGTYKGRMLLGTFEVSLFEDGVIQEKKAIGSTKEAREIIYKWVTYQI